MENLHHNRLEQFVFKLSRSKSFGVPLLQLSLVEGLTSTVAVGCVAMMAIRLVVLQISRIPLQMGHGSVLESDVGTPFGFPLFNLPLHGIMIRDRILLGF